MNNPNVFEFRQPPDEEKARMNSLRQVYAVMLEAINEYTRAGSCSGRYAALARTALEESAMWGIKSIGFERDNA
jgi:hypothetical protein